MKIDWKLKGFNLLKFGCGKEVTVHPETCSDMVLMRHNNNKSLADWITDDSTLETKSSLSKWLEEYYATATLAVAKNDTLDPLTQEVIHYAGIIYPSEGLTIIDDAGGLSIAPAKNDTFGGIKLGYTDTNNTRRVQIDSSGNAFVSIDNISVDNYLQDWNGSNLSYAARIYTASDAFNILNLNDYYQTFVNYFTTNIPSASRIYPVRADRFGRLYAFVNWSQTPISIFANKPSGSDCGYVPTASSVTDKANKYLNANGNWASVSYNSLLNRPSVLGGSTTSGFLVPSSSAGDSTKFLRGDGVWAIPTDTTYSADNESIIMATGNVFYDPHQYSRTTNKHGEIADHLNLPKFRKIDYKVVGLPADSSAATELGNDLFNILEIIAKLPDNGSATITYGYDYDDELSWTMDSSSEFISKYSAGNIKLNIYGDITVAAGDSSNLPSSATSLTFSTGTTSTNTHHDIAFSFVKEESKIDLTIVCIKNVAVTIS